MTDVLDTIRFVAGPGTPGFAPIDRLIIPPVPGGIDLGSIVETVIQRLPLPRPRPRLPGPRGPSTTGPTFPFPVPIPFPTDIFGGTGDCPQQLCCPKGFHPNKSMTCAGEPPGSKCVRNRRMNPANARAAKRSVRRLSAFDRLARQTKKELKKLCR